mmetsp:Transcript_101945/g.186762  ORF Transcript_101945/g.186762 Transcript_101945/m.186762 type:complete len:203 (+) Transcript_101945:6-614(+)
MHCRRQASTLNRCRHRRPLGARPRLQALSSQGPHRWHRWVLRSYGKEFHSESLMTPKLLQYPGRALCRPMWQIRSSGESQLNMRTCLPCRRITRGSSPDAVKQSLRICGLWPRCSVGRVARRRTPLLHACRPKSKRLHSPCRPSRLNLHFLLQYSPCGTGRPRICGACVRQSVHESSICKAVALRRRWLETLGQTSNDCEVR